MSSVRHLMNPRATSKPVFSVMIHLTCPDVRFNRSLPDQKAKKQDPKVNFGV